ncbi:hypothetical protein ACFWFI_38965 [Streptomyces sp. NPDC060209]|uniref:hypothetical protein n=1 Tax=Streptomyces sp. NPDC060209 TaxID=3347073 RepID=UPI00364D33BA
MQPVRVAGLSLVVGPAARPVRAELGDECRAVQQLLDAPPGDVDVLSVERAPASAAYRCPGVSVLGSLP